MEHADLVSEMAQVEHLSTQDRLHLARMRRAQQLKVAKQREKEWLKAQRSKDRLGNQHMSTYKRHITFEDSVVLLEAAARNDIAEVAKLLQKGVTPDATNMDGLTALHQCCIDDNAEMLNLLLDYGANVNAQDSERWTPLHAAATCGHLNLVKILIGRGANLLSVNADGNMPYDICDDEEALDYIEAEMSKRGVTQELIDETRAATETKMLVDLQETAARQDGDLEVPDSAGATPLHIASANGYTRVVEFLLEQHVATDAVDHDLWTPVHAAACWGHLEVLEMLAQAGADLNAKNKNDETPSDICEDPEIRERIEQLKTEQESKRLAEAQRKRVRRSQSNNTSVRSHPCRAQSVRRTSLRDKGLTTKKDAVEEARFRLQAQEGYTTPDGVTTTTTTTTATAGSNGSNASAVTAATNGDNPNSKRPPRSSNLSSTDCSPSIPPSKPTAVNNSKNTNGHLNSVNNNSITSNNNNNNNSTSVTLNNGLNNTRYNHNNNLLNNNNNNSNSKDHNNGGYHGGTANTSGTSSAYSSQPPSLNQYDRRSPEGKDNDSFLNETTPAVVAGKILNGNHNNNQNNNNTVNNSKILALSPSASSSVSSSTAAAVNGNLVSSNSSSNNNNTNNNIPNATATATATEVYSTSNNENGKINVQVTVLVGTLADLKKHRSQNRSSVSPENGSLLSAQGLTTNGNGQPLELSLVSTGTSDHYLAHGNGEKSAISTLSSATGNGVLAADGGTAVHTPSGTLNKFSGNTSDVVSDSTRSRRCCVLM
ncbi:protein phosphatase 1 regulatory inhibitor subunit 16B isoform X2 [Culex quinquefasciatus]|uniref:protein phosphatase 1 regulatory inhibitor subunit 16B isoform X2 n=1 Tax=Culex quinquefasciatus TaxID=7176 RepID=UPI0018E2C4F1|nr:protein phosphatase 1 regulatory inhibitor subunit 16B isoform X2 [Culex quinquefasciatus]